MKKRFYSALCRFICPSRLLFGTWGLYREYGVNANDSFDRDCTLYDCWMILNPDNSGYWDERGETETLRWHRIGCRRIAVEYPGLYPFRKIVRLTRDELWLRTDFGHKDKYWRVECYRRGTPPPDPEPIYELYCASLDKATENDR